jgi:hypothetical protein
MSDITTELQRILNAKNTLKTKLQNKGVAVRNEKLDGLVNLVDSIQSGTGTKVENGVLYITNGKVINNVLYICKIENNTLHL